MFLNSIYRHKASTINEQAIVHQVRGRYMLKNTSWHKIRPCRENTHLLHLPEVDNCPNTKFLYNCFSFVDGSCIIIRLNTVPMDIPLMVVQYLNFLLWKSYHSEIIDCNAKYDYKYNPLFTLRIKYPINTLPIPNYLEPVVTDTQWRITTSTKTIRKGNIPKTHNGRSGFCPRNSL